MSPGRSSPERTVEPESVPEAATPVAHISRAKDDVSPLFVWFKPDVWYKETSGVIFV